MRKQGWTPRFKADSYMQIAPCRFQRCSGGGDTAGKKVRTLPQNRRGYLMRLLEIEIASDRVCWVLGSCERQSDAPCVDETENCLRREDGEENAEMVGCWDWSKTLWIQAFW